ncbi:hypothetical protein [Streptomyces sp. NPDC053560]|uniref:hypothetical protein n=1 Tax=Streptomyces sp. NPDC053560 TaxID=3365711 RepID=UPI0037D20B72
MEQAAEQSIESACHLADLVSPNAWSTAAAEDVLDAIDTLTEALGGAGPELAQALAAVAAATTDARRRLGIIVEGHAPEDDAAAPHRVMRGAGRSGGG